MFLGHFELLGVPEKKREPHFVLVRRHLDDLSRNLPARAKSPIPFSSVPPTPFSQLFVSNSRK
jgi:hypothetical protein